MKQISRQYLLISFGLLAVLGSYGQGGFPLGGITNGGGGSSKPGMVVHDTSDIYYFHADNPNLVFPFSDSLLGTIHQYDPIRQRDMDYASLGNLGSAHRPLFYQPVFRRGFDVGLHQFDLYQLPTADVRFYKIEQAYTQAGFSQGPTQNDLQFNVRFSRNFAKGVNLSLEHRRINNTGSYDFQKATDSDAAFGLWFHNKKGKYNGFLTYVSNSVQQENNGGADAADLNGNVIQPFQVGVNLRTANTRYANQEYAFAQYFYLNRIVEDRKATREERLRKREEKAERKAREKEMAQMGKDSLLVLPDTTTVTDTLQKRPVQDSLARSADKISTGPAKASPPPARRPSPPAPPPTLSRNFTLYHQIAWRKDFFKSYDTSPDSAFYQNFLVDSRGLRFYLETRRLENTVKLQTFKLKEQPRADSTGRALPQESDLLEVGLVHSLWLVDQEPLARQTVNNLFLTGRLNFSPGGRLRVQTYGHLGVGTDAGDFRLSGELFLNLKKIGTLRIGAVNQLYSPSLLHERFFVSQQAVWNNGFGKILETSISGTYTIPLLHFSAGGQYHLVNNLVYFDTAGMPRQAGALSIFQLIISQDFRVGAFHLDNWAGLQKSTSDVLRLPEIYSKHSLYFTRKIFKQVMMVKVGFDARLTTGYAAPTYQPLTGQFYLQNERTLPFTPLLDFFLSFKVQTFRFFAKIENVLGFYTNNYYQQTAGYPLPYGLSNGGLRLGINWRLVD
ncbi:MAG: putative porin [Saprospiraceae bacterium]